MSDSVKPPMHGRDHRPGGSDPIPVTAGPPPVFRAAIGAPKRGGTAFDPELHRIHYVSGDEGNNVFWDTWDTSFDTTIFNITPYLQTNDATEGQVIGGVELLKRGLYSIHAVVDVDSAFNGTSLLKSNWDGGQGEFRLHNNAPGTTPTDSKLPSWWKDWLVNGFSGTSPGGSSGVPYWGDLYGIRLDHWRWLELSNTDTTPPITFHNDDAYELSASTVEIVLSVNTIGGKVVTLSSPYVSMDDVWIPGGRDGAWGMVPNLYVAYWGLPPSGADASWVGTIPT